MLHANHIEVAKIPFHKDKGNCDSNFSARSDICNLAVNNITNKKNTNLSGELKS